MWKDLTVYLIGVIASIYAAWRWTPIEMRASVVSTVILFAKRWGLSNERAMKWQMQASTKTGCGSCGPCKACKTDRPDHVN